MSGANAARSLPPGDRDEAPELPIEPERHDDAPPLTDETDEARLHRLGRHFAEATKHFTTAVIMLAAGKSQAYASAMSRCATDLTEAASLSRLLSRSTTAKR